MRALDTARLTIRSFALPEADTYARLLDEAFGAAAYGSRNEKRIMFEYQVAADAGMALRDHGPFHFGDRALLGALFPEHQDRGYATEAAAAMVSYAFDVLRLLRIVATTEHDNARSISVMRRLDMRLERNPAPEPTWFQTVGILDHSS